MGKTGNEPLRDAGADGGAAAETVGTIMTRRVVTVELDTPLRRLREIFDQCGFHHLVVLDGQRVAGVISDRDILKHLSPFAGKTSERRQDAFTLERRAHQVMTRRLISCDPRTPLAEAGRLMLDHTVSCLPVLEADGRCVGIVTLRDLLAWSLVRCAGRQDTCPVHKAA